MYTCPRAFYRANRTALGGESRISNRRKFLTSLEKALILVVYGPVETSRTRTSKLRRFEMSLSWSFVSRLLSLRFDNKKERETCNFAQSELGTRRGFQPVQ